MITWLAYRTLPNGDKEDIVLISILTLFLDVFLFALIFDLLQEINMGALLLGAIAGYFYARNQEKVNQWLGKQFNKHFGS